MQDVEFTYTAPVLEYEVVGIDINLWWSAAESPYASFPSYELFRLIDGGDPESLGVFVAGVDALEYTDPAPAYDTALQYFVIAAVQITHNVLITDEEQTFAAIFGRKIRGETRRISECGRTEVVPSAPPSVIPPNGRVK